MEKLEGIDRVRVRPAVIFGSKDKSGAVACIKNIVAMLIMYCEHINISLDEQGFIVIKASNLDTRKLWSWELQARENKDIKLTDGSFNDYYIIKAVCGEMVIINYYGNNTVEYAVYKEGKLESQSFREALPEEKYSVIIKYKPSHEVFNYDTITKEDLNFVSIGE